MSWKSRPRSKPYTDQGIRRVPCVRCHKPALHQWQVCADGNKFRALCLDCDIELNRLVLEWAGDPDHQSKCDRYESESRKQHQS